MKTDKPCVLLVDDSSTNNLLLETAFRNLNFQISTATSGEEALQMMRETTFHLVLLDVMMPGLTGYDVLKKMKEENISTKETSVIMVTARSKAEEEKIALDLGAVDYFEKPIDLRVLTTRVKELVAHLQ